MQDNKEIENFLTLQAGEQIAAISIPALTTSYCYSNSGKTNTLSLTRQLNSARRLNTTSFYVKC